MPSPDIPEEARELAAEALWNEREFRDPTGEAPDDWYPPGDNPDQQPPREPFLWEQMVAEGKYEGDQEECRADALAVLQAAAPALRKQGAEEEAERCRELEEDLREEQRVHGQDAEAARCLRSALRSCEKVLATTQAERDQALAKGAEEAEKERDQWRRDYDQAIAERDKLDNRIGQLLRDRTEAEADRDAAYKAEEIAHRERDQALAKGAEEERERLRAKADEIREAIYQDLTGEGVTENALCTALARFDALEDPAPSEGCVAVDHDRIDCFHLPREKRCRNCAVAPYAPSEPEEGK
jgi:hypothetical protein